MSRVITFINNIKVIRVGHQGVPFLDKNRTYFPGVDCEVNLFLIYVQSTSCVSVFPLLLSVTRDELRSPILLLLLTF